MNRPTDPKEASWEGEVPVELTQADATCAFGPSFFLRQLRAFVRGRCPDPSEALPSVQIHLAEGEILDVCHIMGLAPHWMAIAAIEPAHAVSSPAMRTEILPYVLISRITVRPVRPEPGHVGFECDHPSHLFSRGDLPEDSFLAMTGQVQSRRRARSPREAKGGPS